MNEIESHNSAVDIFRLIHMSNHMFYNDMAKSGVHYFNDPPKGIDVGGLMDKTNPYLDRHDDHFRASVESHNNFNYKDAATHLNNAHAELTGLRDMYLQHLHSGHPVMTRFAQYLKEHRGLIDQYKHTTGQGQRVYNEQFDEILKNNNLNSQQFGD